uniref:Methyltranfer_dom domain-containing protein n=1 Tax=Rhodnius prolixus TaxID=13249 RepID=T1HP48_RHOPR
MWKIMDIPKTVEDVELYCERVISLLEEWSWLYQYRATEILLSELLSSESLKLMENLDDHSLSQVPFGLVQSSWPQQLRFFVEECVRLTLKIPVRQSQPVKLTVPNKLRKCTSMKKQHEIDELAPYIMEHCLQSSISRIYDIGSGLGYIDRILATTGGLSIVGVELDSCKIEGAIKLNKELLEQNQSSNIIYIACRLDEENLEHICEQLQCYKENGCLVGLHACGDLSAVSLRQVPSKYAFY